MGDPFAFGGFVPNMARWGVKDINNEFGTWRMILTKTQNKDEGGAR